MAAWLEAWLSRIENSREADQKRAGYAENLWRLFEGEVQVCCRNVLHIPSSSSASCISSVQVSDLFHFAQTSALRQRLERQT